MESDDDCGKKPTIIIDNGSCFIKSGFSNEDSPKSCLRNCIGYPKNKEIYYKDYYLGRQMKGQMNALNLKYPIKDGIIDNWDDLEKNWEYIFKKELEVEPSEYNVILTQPLMNSKNEKEKMAQIMFENFDVSSLYLAYSVDLSFYSSNQESGLFVDLGASSIQMSAFLYYTPIPHKFERLYYGGNSITDYLFELFHHNCKMFYNDKNKSSVEDIKEKACYVALDYKNEDVEPFSYILPDNKEIFVNKERIQATEALFNPELILRENDLTLGLHRTCNRIIEKFNDNDEKVEIYKCIYLSGGNSLFKGLKERLTKELEDLAGNPYKKLKLVNVIISEYGKFSVWMGGQILSNLSTFDKILTTKEMYEESGSSIVYKNDNYMFK